MANEWMPKNPCEECSAKAGNCPDGCAAPGLYEAELAGQKKLLEHLNTEMA
jgi:hypothetical protein